MNEWISVGDQLPREDVIYGKGRLKHQRMPDISVEVIGFNSITRSINIVRLYLPDPQPYTHWMPIPGPPE